MFHIIQWNIQAYRAKFEELMEMKAETPAIICLQETMLKNKIPPDPKDYHKEYYLHRMYRGWHWNVSSYKK